MAAARSSQVTHRGAALAGYHGDAAMDVAHAGSADDFRRRILAGAHACDAFRAALAFVPRDSRDAWLDRVLALDVIPADSSELPRGGVPYLPSSVDALLECVNLAAIGADDTLVDIGSGVGRATAFVHLLTGASAIGIEIQTDLVAAATAMTRAISSRIANIHGDAAGIDIDLAAGTVFLLYCPFSGDRLVRTLAKLRAVASVRPIRLCCIDLPLPAADWLEPGSAEARGVAVYRSSPLLPR